MKNELCPICGDPIGECPALSREDNKTHICSQCGTHQALSDYVKHQYKIRAHTWEDLECWGERELIEYVLELEEKVIKLISTITNENLRDN